MLNACNDDVDHYQEKERARWGEIKVSCCSSSSSASPGSRCSVNHIRFNFTPNGPTHWRAPPSSPTKGGLQSGFRTSSTRSHDGGHQINCPIVTLPAVMKCEFPRVPPKHATRIFTWNARLCQFLWHGTKSLWNKMDFSKRVSFQVLLRLMCGQSTSRSAPSRHLDE